MNKDDTQTQQPHAGRGSADTKPSDHGGLLPVPNWSSGRHLVDGEETLSSNG